MVGGGMMGRRPWQLLLLLLPLALLVCLSSSSGGGGGIHALSIGGRSEQSSSCSPSSLSRPQQPQQQGQQHGQGWLPQRQWRRPVRERTANASGRPSSLLSRRGGSSAASAGQSETLWDEKRDVKVGCWFV